MRLTIIGCGDAFGAGGSLQTSFHVQAGAGGFLIDCGATTLIGMRRLGLDVNGIGTVFVSHLHGDHFGGLPWLLVDAIYVSKRTRPLVVTGPRGIEQWLEARGHVQKSQYLNPVFEILTGQTASSGDDADDVCTEDVPIPGDLKVCNQTWGFGEFTMKSKPIRVDNAGELINRSEVLDLKLLNNPFAEANKIVPSGSTGRVFWSSRRSRSRASGLSEATYAGPGPTAPRNGRQYASKSSNVVGTSMARTPYRRTSISTASRMPR